MCGIVGFVGRGPAAAPILDALRRLEYRGYDSAGITTLERALPTRMRAVGKLKKLESKLTCEPLVGLIGIGHTRWATHGRPNEKNAHLHAVEGVAVVHNGIIENHRELRNELKLAGVRFATDTDTEVIAHLVNQQLKKGCEPVDAVRVALPRLEGAFALAFLFEGYENLIIGARKGLPLAVGYGRGEMYVGSDAIALAPLTDMISYLEDGDITVVTRPGIDFLNAKGEYVRRSPAKIAGSTIFVQKGEHRPFMVKEIHEQPRVVGQTLAPYIDVTSGTIKIPKVESDFHDINRVSITACGTSFYAGLIARYWFERYAGLPVEIDIASEFRYRNVPLDSGNLAIFVCIAIRRDRRPFGCQRAKLDNGARAPNRIADTRRPGSLRGFHQGVHLPTGDTCLPCYRGWARSGRALGRRRGAAGAGARRCSKLHDVRARARTEDPPARLQDSTVPQSAIHRARNELPAGAGRRSSSRK